MGNKSILKYKLISVIIKLGWRFVDTNVIFQFLISISAIL